MEQIKSQKSLTEKLKRYTIYPLLAISVFYSSLSSQSYADQPDAERIEKLIKVKVTGTITQEEKKDALKAFKEYAKKAKFPKEMIDKVTLDTISDHKLIGGRQLMYMKDGIYITFHKTEDGIMNSFPVINHYEITPEDMAEPLPPSSKGINTVTKKPYFSIPKALQSKLSDKEYFKTLLKVMNTNLGNLVQFYWLDPKKVAKNAYAGKMADERVFFFGEGFDAFEQGLDKTEIALRRKLGFTVDGANEIMKAGGKMHIGVGDCTGWTFHSIDLKSSKENDEGSAFLVFNGIWNPRGIAAYRDELMVHKVHALKKFRENFHEIMREHGVEPGTNIKDKSLDTPDKQVFAYLGNVLDNYQNILRTKALYRGGPMEKYDVMTLDKYITKEIFTPAKMAEKVASSAKTRKMSREREGR